MEDYSINDIPRFTKWLEVWEVRKRAMCTLFWCWTFPNQEMFNCGKVQSHTTDKHILRDPLNILEISLHKHVLHVYVMLWPRYMSKRTIPDCAIACIFHLWPCYSRFKLWNTTYIVLHVANIIFVLLYTNANLYNCYLDTRIDNLKTCLRHCIPVYNSYRLYPCLEISMPMSRLWLGTLV
jgi:hypothetical protein